MSERVKLYTAKTTPAFEPDKVIQKHANMRGIALRHFGHQYDDKLDQFLNNDEWDFCNMSISFDPYFSDYIYYQRNHLARNFWELLHI